MTDSGFRGPWFNYVRSIGWDFLGRVRNINYVQIGEFEEWSLSTSYYDHATQIPTYLGDGILTKDSEVPCQFVIYKEAKKK